MNDQGVQATGQRGAQCTWAHQQTDIQHVEVWQCRCLLVGDPRPRRQSDVEPAQRVQEEIDRPRAGARVFARAQELVNDVKDVVVVGKLYVSSIVVAAYSPVIKTMLTGGMKESKEKEIVFEGKDEAETASARYTNLLRFIYTTELPAKSKPSDLMQLMLLAEEYEVTALVDSLLQLCVFSNDCGAEQQRSPASSIGSGLASVLRRVSHRVWTVKRAQLYCHQFPLRHAKGNWFMSLPMELNS